MAGSTYHHIPHQHTIFSDILLLCPLRSKYSLQQSNLEYPQSKFIPQHKRPSFTLMKKQKANSVLCILICTPTIINILNDTMCKFKKDKTIYGSISLKMNLWKTNVHHLVLQYLLILKFYSTYYNKIPSELAQILSKKN